jgi:hypothetical protein
LYATSNLEALIVIDHWPLLSDFAVLVKFIFVAASLAKVTFQCDKDKLDALAILRDFAYPF